MPRRIAPTLLAGLVFGCGPSFHAIHEGNARFEHCYALEESPQVPMHERADCWRDWSEHYTFGQTRDRIQYATARYVALSQAPATPTDEAMMMAAPGVTPRVTTIAAPPPTNAFQPPPKVLDEDGGTVTTRSGVNNRRLGPPNDGGAPEPAAPPLPSASCADDCAGAYQGCATGCDDAGAGPGVSKARASACAKCNTTYKTCMRACFK